MPVEEKRGLPILAFADVAAWEQWLAAQPRTSPGCWMKIAKRGNPDPSIGKSDAIDGALAHGWIDGQVDRYDDAWFLTRFTPRRPRGNWSAVNVARVAVLTAAGRMTPAGEAEVAAAKADGRWAAAYAPASSASVPDDLAAALAAEPAAAAFFATLTGANRYAILYRIMEAKRPATRAARIGRFVAMCAAGETVHG